MSYTKLTTSLLYLFFSLNSCNNMKYNVDNMSHLKGNGTIKDRKIDYKLSNVNKIEVKDNIELIFSSGDNTENDEIIVQTDENLLDYVNVELKRGRLVIAYDVPNNTNIDFTKSIVKINSPKFIEEINLDDNASLKLSSKSTYSSLKLKLKGNAKSDLNSSIINKLFIDSKGNAQVKIKGEVDNLVVNSKGISKIDALSASVKVAEVTNGDLSYVKLVVTDKISVKNSSSKSVIYYAEENIDDEIDGELIEKRDINSLEINE